MNLQEQMMGDEAGYQLAMHEIVLYRQHRAEDVANRIRRGMATVEDAKWIEAEYGLRNETHRGTK